MPEGRVEPWHPDAVRLNLLLRCRGDQALKAILAEGPLDGLEYPDGELGVPVREAVIGLRREAPDACGAANFLPFIDVVDKSLVLQDGEMLTHSHRRNF